MPKPPVIYFIVDIKLNCITITTSAFGCRAELQISRIAATALASRLFSTSPTSAGAAETLSSVIDAMPLIPSPPPIDLDSVGPVLTTAMSAIDSFHTVTGLPWWATIATVGFGVRTAMLPITLIGMKASAALFPIMRQARAEEEAQASNVGSTNKSDSTPSPPSAAKYTAIARRFHELRVQYGAPHPFWIIGSPMVQLPVFITAMWSIRTMALSSWPGFDTGGVAWFKDLNLPALDLTTLTAPMGTWLL